jgi:hypothetical protein
MPVRIRHGANYLEHEPARWSAQVNIVPQADERHSERCEFGQGVDQMFKRSSKAVNLPDKDRIEPSTTSIRHQTIERWSRFLLNDGRRLEQILKNLCTILCTTVTANCC